MKLKKTYGLNIMIFEVGFKFDKVELCRSKGKKEVHSVSANNVNGPDNFKRQQGAMK